jgi:hypothetical protein
MIQTVAGAAAVLCAQQALAADPTIVNSAKVQYSTPNFDGTVGTYFNNQSASTQNLPDLAGKAEVMATSTPDVLLGASSVTQSALAYSSFGANHASVYTQGMNFSPVGTPLSATASASTSWSELVTTNLSDTVAIYQTYHIHGVVGPTAGTYADDGRLDFTWTQSSAAGTALAVVRGSFLTSTDPSRNAVVFSVTTANNAQPYFNYYGGISATGAVTIDFDVKTRDFGYNNQIGILSSLSLSSVGNVSGDFSNTIGLVDLKLPVGGAIVGSQSGTDYSGIVSYYSPAAVPEPETLALMLAGLGLVGAVTRRRQTSASA